MNDLSYDKILRGSSLRATPLRVTMLRYLDLHHGPFTVREIYENLDRPGNLVTVYRNAEAFVEKGIAVQCDFNDGLIRYELCCDHQDHHHHLICTVCRKWVRVDVCLPKNRFKELEKTGFSQISHKLEFFGMCPKCDSV
jgi:Fur family ferric uptake transcriptional regulator